MEESQTAVWDLDMSQPQRRYKRARTGSFNNVTRRNSVGVPRPIRNRGTATGYYEMPDHTLIRLYGNTTTGLWNTDQTTGSGIGTIGYQGIGISCALDQMQVALGNGAITSSIFKDFTDYNAKCSIFDLAKIVEFEIEIWPTIQTAALNSSLFSAPELWLATDRTDAVPPVSAEELFPCSDIKRVVLDPSKVFKMKVKPYIKYEVSNSTTDTSTSYLPGVAAPATYLNTSALTVKHLGVKGWLVIPTNQTSSTFSLNIKVRRVVRWKSLK